MMAPDSLIQNVKASFRRHLLNAYDRMAIYHHHEESDPTLWLESLIYMPNRGVWLVLAKFQSLSL